MVAEFNLGADINRSLPVSYWQLLETKAEHHEFELIASWRTLPVVFNSGGDWLNRRVCGCWRMTGYRKSSLVTKTLKGNVVAQLNKNR